MRTGDEVSTLRRVFIANQTSGSANEQAWVAEMIEVRDEAVATGQVVAGRMQIGRRDFTSSIAQSGYMQLCQQKQSAVVADRRFHI